LTSDIINALWELAGALFMLRAIIVILEHKEVRGIEWSTIFFFSSWGLWNTIFYPTNGFFWSWVASIFLCAGNITYLILLIYYSRKNKYGNV
jgi:hypothetical protein